MANRVEMELKSYNELMDELKFYKDVFNALIVPDIGEWEIKHLKDEGLCYVSNSNLIANLSKENKDTIIAIIQKKVEEEIMNKYGIQAKMTSDISASVSFGRVSIVKEESGVKEKEVEGEE